MKASLIHRFKLLRWFMLCLFNITLRTEIITKNYLEKTKNKDENYYLKKTKYNNNEDYLQNDDEIIIKITFGKQNENNFYYICQKNRPLIEISSGTFGS